MADTDEVALLKATVLKLHAERKTMHQMLTDAGISSDVLHDGERTCLIGRLGVALNRLPVTAEVSQTPGNICGAWTLHTDPMRHYIPTYHRCNRLPEHDGQCSPL